MGIFSFLSCGNNVGEERFCFSFIGFSLPVIWVCWLCTFFFFAPDRVTSQCTVQSACFPWHSIGNSASRACSREGSINLRFMLDVAPENYFGTEQTKYMIYGFCPTVDELSSFTLNQSTYYATSYKTTVKKDDKEETTYHFSSYLYKNYLSVYGFGNSNNTLIPQRQISLGAVLAAVNGSLVSCGGSSTVAVVSTLMLNIGFDRGSFNYIASSPTGPQSLLNPYYSMEACENGEVPPANVSYCNTSITVDLPVDTKQPAKVGFESTCQNGKCMFDSSAICIEDVNGLSNCGYCYGDPGETLHSTIQVWVSYYGTDNSGNSMISGGSSPLRYMNFASSSLADKFKDKLSSLWNGTQL